MENEKNKKEPLIHIVKRTEIKPLQKVIIYAVSIIVAFLISGIFCSINSDGEGIFSMLSSMFDGVFGTERRMWTFIKDAMLLLGVSFAILPSFKMKFWNLGANGQILVGCLASYAVLFYLGGKVSNGLSVIIMIISAITASVIWSIIPAIFKALFNTNETLFTLMMNYLANGLVTIMITIWYPMGSGSVEPITNGALPIIGNEYLLTVIAVTIITIFMFVYINYSKHGYELAVVGESENTAKYCGINVKKVILRTLILSGVLCGIIGLLITGSINHSVSTDIVNNMGFTAIMTTWLAKFNPLYIILTSVFIVFVSQGMMRVKQDFGFYNNALVNVILGIIYFFIIAVDFFVNYKIIFRGKNNMTKVKEGGIK